MPALRYSLAGVASLVAVAALVCRAAPAKLVCDAPEYDFGSRSDATLGFSHTFDVWNSGAEPIAITAIRSSCDCLTSSLTCRTVKPGEHIPVDTHFSFRDECGPQLRAIHVAYRTGGAQAADPVGVCTLLLRGTILTPIIRLPSRLDLGLVLPGCVATGEVRLVSGRCGPFELRAVGLENAEARAEYVPGISGTNHAVRLLIPAPLRSGAFSGLAVASTDLPEAPTVPIPFAGRVAPLVDIRPASLTVRKGIPLNAHVQLSSPYGTPFHILAASATDPRLTVTVSPQGGDSAKLTVTAEAMAEPFHTALVRLKTDHPVCRTIEIPVRATPRD